MENAAAHGVSDGIHQLASQIDYDIDWRRLRKAQPQADLLQDLTESPSIAERGQHDLVPAKRKGLVKLRKFLCALMSYSSEMLDSSRLPLFPSAGERRPNAIISRYGFAIPVIRPSSVKFCVAKISI
jgi:hypothetical protein